MKRMDLFCTSPVSTTVYNSLETKTNRHAERVQRPSFRARLPIPCTSYQLAITPRRRSSADARDLISLGTPGSSRYLRSDEPFDAAVSESERSTLLIPAKPVISRHSVSCDGSPSLKSSYSAPSHDQVVVLSVSLHCKGCESKVRKHLSRMKGVRSFVVDFEKKKVTVRGDLSPLSVLASVSSVKNARLLWPSSQHSTNSSSSPSSSSSSASSQN